MLFQENKTADRLFESVNRFSFNPRMHRSIKSD